MLTLQKLRDKGGVLLAVLIGIALLAFLLGDMLSSGSVLFGSANKVGKIDGTSINYQDYVAKQNFYTSVNEQLYGNSSENSDRSSQQAWESFIRSIILEPQIEKLGLNVSEDQLKDLVSPENPSPIIAQIFVNPQTGLYSQELYTRFLESFNYNSTEGLMDFMSYLKSESSYISSMSTFAAVLRGGYFPTDLDVSANVALNKPARNIKYAYAKVYSVPDSVVQYTDADINKFYKEHKNFYRRDEQKTINYVTFDVLPSTDDYIAAQKYADEMAADFASAQNPKLYAEANSSDKSLSHYYSKSQLDTDMAQFVFPGNSSNQTGVFGPKLVDRTYTMARVCEVKNIPDSMNLSVIALTKDNEKLVDSIMNVLNGGADFSSLAVTHSLDPQSSQNGGIMGTIDPTTLSEQFAPLYEAKTGSIVKIESSNSVFIFKVNSVENVQPKAYVAMVTYDVEPSKETRNYIFNRASKFAVAAAGGIDNFMSVTSDSVLDLRTAIINTQSTGIEGIDNSREAVTWALAHGEEEGTSGVMEFGDMYFVAALSASQERGIAPLDKVRNEVKNALLSQLKGEYLKEKLAGVQSVEEAVNKINGKTSQAEGIKFSTYSFPESGFDMAFAGGLSLLKPGMISKPIVSLESVYLAQEIDETESELSDSQSREMMKAEIDNVIFQSAFTDVYLKSEIIDQRFKLYR